MAERTRKARERGVREAGGQLAGNAGGQTARNAGGGLALKGRDDDAVRSFIEHVALTFGELGFPRMAARVLFVIMCADEDALTAGQIGERLGVSPAAVSTAVRYLQQIQMLQRQPVPGSRSDRYRLPDDAWYEVSSLKATVFKAFAVLARDGVDALGGTTTRAGARVARMADFFEFVHNEMPGLLERWRATRGDRD